MEKSSHYYLLVVASAVFPVLFLYSANVELVTFSQVVVPCLISLALAGFLVLLSFIITKNRLKQNLLVSPLLILFWFYQVVSSPVLWFGNYGFLYGLILYCIVYLGLCYLLYSIKTKRNLLSLYIIIFSSLSVLLAFNAVRIVYASVQAFGGLENINVDSNASLEKVENMPDIVFLVLDELASFKTIKREWNYEVDRSAFDKAFVAEDTEVRYANTSWSLPSTLNLEYLTGPIPKAFYQKWLYAPKSIPRSEIKLKQMLGGVKQKTKMNLWSDNFLMRYLKKRGYKIQVKEALSTKVNVNFDHVDLHMSPTYFLRKHQPNSILKLRFENPFLMEFIENSVFRYLIGYDTRVMGNYHITKGIFQELNESIGADENPTFTYAHILCPHLPMIFDEAGNYSPISSELAPNGKYWDVEQDARFRAGYLKQYRYVLSEIRNLLNEVIKDNNTVLIVQSDHGPRPDDFYLKDMTEAFSVCNIIYYPDQDYSDLYNDIGTPNTMRAVLNKFFNEQYPMIDER